MKERPILFSGPMVRALLAGTKTQTRRVCAIPPGWSPHGGMGRITSKHPRMNRFGAFIRHDVPFDGDKWMHDIVPCPYGQPGDRLWVRESFAHIYRDNKVPEARRPEDVVYMADGFTPDKYAYGAWKPSIHMSRWASRIILEITAVRVERLQDISEADAQAEGCALECMTPTGDDGGSAIYGPGGYLALWEGINGPGSWTLNPWVWVVEFKRITP